jgi:DNA-binding response OmpR family regulator
VTGERVTPAVRPRHTEGTESILVVEDDDSVRGFVQTVLEARGYRVLAAANADDAVLQAVRHDGPIGLLLTDVVMPGMSGADLAARLREIAPDVKVLFVSGYTENTIVHHGVLDPGVSFLAKPFSPDALAERVRAELDA